MAVSKPQKEYYARSRKTWRSWLQKNHARATHVWLVIYKKNSGVPSLTYAEAVEEALCFGWIDSRPNKRDGESFLLYFTSRKTMSPWSKINKVRVARLIKDNLMTAAGMIKIEEAKMNGSWNTLDNIEKMVMPAVLKKEFSKNKTARKYFEAFPPSVKKAIFLWVESAKLDTTRHQRVKETVDLAARNIRANQWKRKI